MIGTIVGIAILALAAWIIARGCIRFKRTGGNSACASCPFSNHCSKCTNNLQKKF